MLKISVACYLGLSPVISTQFTVEMCTAAWNCEKFTKTPILGVQGRSRSSMLVPPESSSAVLVMISRKSCVYLQPFSTLDELIVVKLRFLRGYPSFMPSFEGNLLTQRHQVISLETRDSRLSYGGNPDSLSGLSLIRYRVVTPGQTDERTDRQNSHS